MKNEVLVLTYGSTLDGRISIYERKDGTLVKEFEGDSKSLYKVQSLTITEDISGSVNLWYTGNWDLR